MKNSVLLLLVFVLFLPLAFAKRIPPKPVAAIVHDGVEYSVPHQHMGCVYAKDSKNKRLLWWRQIYVVKYDIEMERDVQDVFITSIRVNGGYLIVTNEDGGRYKLDLDTLEVAAVPMPKMPFGTWVHSYEDDQGAGGNVYLREGTKEFPPSRFRMKYIFAENGSCQWRHLSSRDAHSMQSGKWQNDDGVIRVYDKENRLVQSLQIVSFAKDRVVLKAIPN